MINQYKFRDDTSALAFATMEITNKTEGYDFSEKNPYLLNLYFDIMKKLPHDDYLTFTGKIYYSGDVGIIPGGANPKMTSNHWGPVMIAFAAGNVFGPNFDEDGNPNLEKLEIYVSYLSKTYATITIPAMWK